MWEKEVVPPATTILRQGQIPKKVYVLVNGNVQLVYKWKEKKPNSSRHLMQRDSK
jgi:CRP-like cAMP-binding protein